MSGSMTGGIRFVSAGPLSVLAILLLIGFAVLLIPLLILGITGAAFTRLGLSWIEALVLVLLMLAGSFVNIPLYRIRRDMIRAAPMDSGRNVLTDPFAAPPVWETMISVNFGGGLVPVGVAVFMIYKTVMVTGTGPLVPVAICGILVMVVSFLSTRKGSGVGIRVPLIIPALTALLAGVLLSGGTGLTAAVTALAGGVFGTIAGGNFAHLFRAGELEVPDVSIGGSGTFGAVFLCCILPALIA
jgi:uncharacterized membrane protein